MKKLALLVLAFCLVSSYAFAEETISTATETTVPAATGETIEITGTVIDNMCAGEQTPEQLSEFIMMHDKSCALMSHCAASDYAIFADGKLTKFDADSNAKVAEFLNKDDSKLDVVVTAKKVGDELSLVSIENQK
jgi:hypothetical protein